MLPFFKHSFLKYIPDFRSFGGNIVYPSYELIFIESAQIYVSFAVYEPEFLHNLEATNSIFPEIDYRVYRG